jgi:hypothetical protein
MKDIRVRIKAPITEHCKKCDYEASRSFSRYSCKCPKCGDSVSRGRRAKNRHVYARSYEGSFNFANPSEKQWQYTFYNIPEFNHISFVVDDELDDSCPYSLVWELKDIIDRYLVSSNKPKINKLYDILMAEGFQEKDARVKLENDIYDAKAKLYELLEQSK